MAEGHNHEAAPANEGSASERGWRHTADGCGGDRRGPACLGRPGPRPLRRTAFLRPCLIVTHIPAVVESEMRSTEWNLLGVALATQQPPDGKRRAIARGLGR